jgi:hypothetical protein
MGIKGDNMFWSEILSGYNVPVIIGVPYHGGGRIK